MQTLNEKLQYIRNKMSQSRHARVVAILLLLFLIVLGSLLIWRYFLLKQAGENGTVGGAVDASKIVETEKAPTSPIERARQQAMDGDTDKAQNTLLDYLKANPTKEAQYQGYLELAVIASNAGQNDSAKNYALKADEADPTPRSAWLVARAAQRLGEKLVAIDYYQRAIDRYPPADQRNAVEQRDVENMQQSIKILRSQ